MGDVGYSGVFQMKNIKNYHIFKVLLYICIYTVDHIKIIAIYNI